MKKITLFILSLLCISAYAQESVTPTRYVGGDISMLPQYEKYNYSYRDAYNNKISNMINWFINDCGWNTFRVRIFVHPTQKAKGTTDLAVCQDLAYVTALGKRIKEAGAYFMLDFHYSDEWVDAGHIQAPVAWQGASDEVMADSVAAHTREVLTALKEAGAAPDLVQVGNEIMYGLCGIQVHPYNNASDNWEGYLGLLKAGCNTVRDVLPEAKIIIHSDRPTNRSYDYYYYDKLRDNGVDYDIIGLSYYPFWHAGMTPTDSTTAEQALKPLVSAVNYLKQMFSEKEVQIVETAYNFQYWPTEGVNYDTRALWACSKKGQYQFVKDLVDAMLPLENLTGINYWFPEEAGNGDKGSVMGGWLNRGFWNPNQTSSSHYINRTGAPATDQDPAEVCAPYYLGKFRGEDPQGIESIQPSAVRSQKVMRDGQLYLMYKGTMYDVQGRRIGDW
ncbi:MAG: glycosyl hydrolase 53 family protein [Paludibacteraceae bacterium]|nr:glycosyl hydrolase 53 family protein [Paludibacteraceae bacterium]